MHVFLIDLITVRLAQVADIQAEVLVKQRDCEHDLAKAEPSLTAATAALHTLNKVPRFISHRLQFHQRQLL